MIEITGHPGGPGVRVGFPVVDHAAGFVLVAVARHQVQPPYAGVSPHVDPERTLIGAPRIHHAGVNVSQAAPSDGSAGLP
jgi:hypothetical protein